VKATAVRDAREAVRDGIRSGALKNAHDISEGGLAVALAECCAAGGIGARVRLDVDLFAEAPGTTFVVSGHDPIGTVIGRVGGSELAVEGRLKVAVSELQAALQSGLPRFA
jgi:phosphoribosylformylglycinamidine synthase